MDSGTDPLPCPTFFLSLGNSANMKSCLSYDTILFNNRQTLVVAVALLWFVTQ